MMMKMMVIHQCESTARLKIQKWQYVFTGFNETPLNWYTVTDYWTHHANGLWKPGTVPNLSLQWVYSQASHITNIKHCTLYWVQLPARAVTVTVTEALVLRLLLEDRQRITESIRILVPVDRMKQKCFQITTKQVHRSQQFQWQHYPLGQHKTHQSLPQCMPRHCPMAVVVAASPWVVY